MGTVLGYIFALLAVGGVLFLAASYAFGRGEELAPVLPEGTPLELPDDRLARGDDLRALKLSVALRGYRMDEVDWLLERLSEQVDSRDREIARLRSVLHVEPMDPPDEPELLTHRAPEPADDDRPAADGLRAPGAEGGLHGRGPEERLRAPWGDDRSRVPGPEDRLRAPGAEDRLRAPGPDDRLRAPGAEDRSRAPGPDDGLRAYPVPEGTGDSGARPDRPARDIRTTAPREPE